MNTRHAHSRAEVPKTTHLAMQLDTINYTPNPGNYILAILGKESDGKTIPCQDTPPVKDSTTRIIKLGKHDKRCNTNTAIKL